MVLSILHSSSHMEQVLTRPAIHLLASHSCGFRKGICAACRHEGGLLNFLRSVFESLKLRFALISSHSLPNSHGGSSRFRILRKECKA